MIATARSTILAFLAAAALSACATAPSAPPPASQPTDVEATLAPPTPPATDGVALVTPAPPPTLAALPTKILMAYDGPVSPDGRWRLRTLTYDETAHAPLGTAASAGDRLWNYFGQFVATTDGSVTHTIRTGWMPDGLGGPAPQTLGWSPDSQAAFVYTGAYPDGCGLGGVTEEILRFDVAGQTLRAIGTGPGHPTLSSDGTAVAYVQRTAPETGELSLLDVASGETRRWRFPLGADDPAGEPEGVSIAPDGSAAVISVHHDACGNAWRNALVYVDLTTGAASELVPAGTVPLRRTVAEWLPDGTLAVQEQHSPMSGTTSPEVVRRIPRP